MTMVFEKQWSLFGSGLKRSDHNNYDLKIFNALIHSIIPTSPSVYNVYCRPQLNVLAI